MRDIDKWFAEQCGVKCDYDPFNFKAWWEMEGQVKLFYLWTIHDPRCREVIRERFFITTMPHNDRKQWLSWASDIEGTTELGKTIAEAEIACCESIYEAREGE